MRDALEEFGRGASAGELGFAVAVLALVGLAGLWFARHALARARLLEDTPTSLIRSAAQGYCELVGHAEAMPGAAIRAPLSGAPCVWWHYSVAEKAQHGKNNQWRVIEQDVSDALFALDDPTGRCVVDPDGATVIPTCRHVWFGDGPRPLLSHEHGARWAFGHRYRYLERRIDVGSELLAIGTFETHGDPYTGADAQREVALKLAEWKRDPGRLKARFDADGDGQVDMQEWEAARAAARAEVGAQLAERALTPGVNLMRAPQDSRPYLLSVVLQETLVRRQRWQACGGLAGAGVCLWLLLELLAARGG